VIFFTHIFQPNKLNCFVFTFLLIIVCSHSANAQIVVRIPDIDTKVSVVKETRDGKLWIATGQGVFQVDGNKATQITDKNMQVLKFIETRDGKIWLSTREGLLRVDGDKTTRITDKNTQVLKFIETRSGKVWLWMRLLTTNEHLPANSMRRPDCVLFRVDGDRATRIPDKDTNVQELIETQDRKLLIATGHGAYRVDKDKLTSITNKDVYVRKFIETKDGNVWLSTREGLLRVDGDEVTRITDKDIYVREFIETKEGKVWITAKQGLFRVDEDKATRIVNKDIGFPNFTKINNEKVWIAARRQSVFRVNENNITRMPPDKDMDALELIVAKDGTLWMASGHGVFRIDGNKITQMPDKGVEIKNFIETKDGKLWLTTNHGAFRVNGDEVARIPDKDLYVRNFIETKDGKVWLITNHGTFRVDGDKVTRITDKDIYAREFIETKDEKVWLRTDHGAFRVNGNEVTRIPDKNMAIYKIKETKNGKLWLSTKQGVFMVDGDRVTRITDKEAYGPNVFLQIKETKDGKVWLTTLDSIRRVDGDKVTWIIDNTNVHKFIETKDGKVFLATNKGLFQVDGNKTSRISYKKIRPKRFIETKNGKVWLMTDHGAFRIDEGIKILVKFESTESWWKRLIWELSGGKILISGSNKAIVSYMGCIGNEYPCGNDLYNHFMIYMDTDDKSLEKRIEENRFVFSNDKLNRIELSVGIKKIHYFVSDKWGNQTEKQIGKYWVIPGAAFLPIIIFFLCPIIIFISFLLAPYSSSWHNFLMNPYLRNICSFGFIPLFVTIFPSFRKRMLERYKRAISKDDDFARWQVQFIIPSQIDLKPETFCDLLLKERKLFLSGQSGTGKTVYFKHLVGLLPLKRSAILKNVVPVFIPLVRYHGKNFEEMFHAQLSNYGGMTDKSLNKRLLEQGPFLILIDGLNEVGSNTRREMNRFVTQHWQANYFCISSQEYDQDFSWIPEVKMKSLDPEQIEELFCMRLGKKEASRVINQLGKSTYEIYKVPQNIEFAIDIVSDKNRSLPKTELELYEGMLLPILDKWTKDGRQDYSDIINKRAYEMLCTKEQFFNPDHNPFPEGLLNPLAEKRKFLIPMESNYIFRHDLIRGYLAAKYFAYRWQELLSDDKIIVGSNWISMLKFSVTIINKPNEIHLLLLEILHKDIKLAEKLFVWLKQTDQTIYANWADEFPKKLGEKRIKELEILD